MNISIKINYKRANINYFEWANEEDKIDFFKDHKRAARCTVSFAAKELKHFIEKMGVCKNAVITDEDSENFTIELVCKKDNSDSEAFTLCKTENGIKIIGQGRVGVLYGVYEFLKKQGCHWYAPAPADEIIPELSDFVWLPEDVVSFAPSMDCERGFVREGFTPYGEHFWLWMARNKFNADAPCDDMIGFQKKVGIKFTFGGHIFEEILDPKRILSSGKSIFEEHKDWYGFVEGNELTEENALDVQFCVTNKAALNYIADAIVERLKGKWKYIEILHIAGFDTWGKTCECEECKKLGNTTDQFLHYISFIRDKINKAKLDRKVTLFLSCYEGTSSIEPPMNDIPANMVEAGDRAVFFPIMRCYAHTLVDSDCAVNKFFEEHLKGWLNKTPSIPVQMGEYYNVTKFEDLPYLFNEVMIKDIRKYKEMGVRGLVYLHVPKCNLSMRALTHTIMSELSFDADADIEKIIDEYFNSRYGKFSTDVKKAYELIEKASKECAGWRSWSGESVLSQLLCWDGSKPEKEIASYHFENTAAVIEEGKKCVALLEEAKAIFQRIKNERDNDADGVNFSCGLAVNPFLLGQLNKYADLDFRIDEDYRLLVYGFNVMKLTHLLVTYYDSRLKGKANDSVWAEIENLSAVMDSRYALPGAHSFNNGLVCPDELSRSQLRNLVKRCRIMKNKKA